MLEASKKYVVIVAGGKGLRMNAPVPKQFLNLRGLPVLMHSIQKFSDSGLNPTIVLALPSDQIPYWQGLCKEFNFDIPITIVPGGETRFHSVQNALQVVTEPGIIAVHDAVRPLVSNEIIHTAFREAMVHGNAIPAIPLNDSIRKVEYGSNNAVDRSLFRIIQTPQCFDVQLLKRAYQQEYSAAITDDATLVEALGVQIHLIHGAADNIKITHPQDLQLAEALMVK